MSEYVDGWSAELGNRWRLWAALGALLLFAFGVAAPLADADLPMHLATGAWIVQHHGLPRLEPFAWTRWAAPYYAYSWLPEIAYYFLYMHWGAPALRALHGLTQASTGLALLWLARVNGWKSWTAILVVFLTIAMSVITSCFLRPQALLVPLIVLSWACGLKVLDTARPARWAAALAIVAATAANTHLLFLLTGLPLAVAISKTPLPRRRVALIALALLGGWLATPYGLDWPRVFALNFGHNALFDYPSPILEFTPGFRFASKHIMWMALAATLALTPWGLRDVDSTPRERLVLGATWFVGLVGFGMALRAILVWWFAALPVLVRVLERLPTPRTRPRRRTLLLTAVAFPLALTGAFAALDAQLGGGIEPPARANVEPLADWLDKHVRLPEGSRPRVLTNFDYGSYLTWRLPAYSMSVDGRTIFPDSAAEPDAYRFSDQGPFPLGVWRSADLAIVPLRVPVAAVLDTARGWVRIDTVPKGRRVSLAAGLWVRESWLRAVRQELP